MSNANEVIAPPDSPATPSAIVPVLTMSHAQLATLFAEIKVGKERAEQAAIVLADNTSLMKDVIASLLASNKATDVASLTNLLQDVQLQLEALASSVTVAISAANLTNRLSGDLAPTTNEKEIV